MATIGLPSTCTWSRPIAASAPTRLGVDHLAGAQHGVAGAHVRAAADHVLAAAGLDQHQHLLAGVEPRRRRPVGASGRPVSSTMTTASAPSGTGAPVAISDAVARRDRSRERFSRVGAADQAQHHGADAGGAGDIRGADRIPVHRRAIERRLVHGRDDVLRHDAAVGHAERDGLVARQRRRSRPRSGVAPRRW